MNSVGLVGTLLPTLMLQRIRIDFTFIFSALVIASSVFAMIGLKDLASTAVITVLFGFFIGSCKSIHGFSRWVAKLKVDRRRLVFSLQAPMVALLTDDSSQLGCVPAIFATQPPAY